MFSKNEFSELKKQFEKENQLEYFAKGQRSLVYRANYNNQEVIIKVEKKNTDVLNKIVNEIKWLKELNQYNIGPKLIDYGGDFLIAEFIKGILFKEWLLIAEKEEIINLVIKILKQCRKLDELLVSKEEMHNPFKHIIIKHNEPIMIDFERSHTTLKPKNVTQFFQYLTSENISAILKEKEILLKNTTEALKEYKKDYSEESFHKLLELLK
ncbi:MAG: hypothetical protein KKA65_02850 [Nanoarchaeota archaeon]|nr:hypothetical protein [Nanoarchaeota archaeon]MBU4242094.1 hypothetical protein [Nanoarchaeota archaeon]MBU4352547.1 hypothetical protein [Nanoarchaeota archaeon]MBU4456416.1 hypothetical protein [Nanoarchaeota archaeon]MCG2720195.1 hypothetical protein [Nanoarchaeota archaeon]